VVAEIADRVLVMYAGRKVEEADVVDLFENPQHPYTVGLMGSIPHIEDIEAEGGARAAFRDPGHRPVARRAAEGCAFAERCSFATDRCRAEYPPLEAKKPGHVSPAGTATGCRSSRHDRAATACCSRSRDLRCIFPVRGGLLQRAGGRCLRGGRRDFEVGRGETLGIVGESGCGKSTAGKAILKLIEPTAGSIRLRGTDITTCSALRPDAPLPPQTAGDLPGPLRLAQPAHARPATSSPSRSATTMSAPSIPSGWTRSPTGCSAMSGCRRDAHAPLPARILRRPAPALGIARALALNPELIIADEPVSALDVSVQAQVINLMMDLQQEFNLAYLFIAHDLAVVQHISHRIAVMYLGKIVEITDKRSLFRNPQHPYTEALLAAVPVPNPRRRRERHRAEGRRAEPDQPAEGLQLQHPLPLRGGALLP
jgi:oligopeptide/dipeptide ABC transporter ATP-binding protein